MDGVQWEYSFRAAMRDRHFMRHCDPDCRLHALRRGRLPVRRICSYPDVSVSTALSRRPRGSGHLWDAPWLGLMHEPRNGKESQTQ